MKHNLGIFVSILSVAWCLDSHCDDMDSDLCKTFNLHVNVCSNPCLSKICPRTCDKCPRKCYSCNDANSLDNCNTTRICPDRTYKCLVHEGIASDFSITYQLGCATNLVCSSLFGNGRVLGRRKKRSINGECCNSDLCNKHDPSKKRQIVISLETTTTEIITNRTDVITNSTIGSMNHTSTPITNELTFNATQDNIKSSFMTSTNTKGTTTLVPVTTTSKKPGCADIDTASCQKLASLKRDMCSDDCFVQVCPRTCGKCPECYSCIFLDTPENCTDRSVCSLGEKCYVVEEYLDNGEHGYRAGCLHEDVCTRFHINAGNVFGRRSDHLGLILDGDCCNGDLCNHHPIIHTTSTTTTTHAPTHAPTHTITHAPTQSQSTTTPPG
ncbi:uncharacterized protein LOC134247632 [Saccostrea cucullata]|uniref:uncharacterized protein LOC134247632 n=1 Tax=Saccostrea cuccullata TaxID=36930 RepID=UPI002ED15C8E